ncbi:cytidine deaminase [Taklimakanibacter lacteus]|uniref:cytidine deaminase n=1 Tax=Taklimakanibacter lacteus TaxID=2268456 RepID=UPI000E66F3E0
MADKPLIAAAVAARSKAYAPYSRFLVGAAVKDETGAIHAGCNVENAAYPQGTCAEAGAVAAMVLAGGRKIVEAAVVGAGEGLVTPCGGCRQKLREFGSPGLAIHVCDETGMVKKSFTLEELLPSSFGPENLA